MQSSRGSGSLHHVDITRIMRTSGAAASRHHAAAAHSSALYLHFSMPWILWGQARPLHLPL
ncbi:hypothetical protein STEG23_026580, partial [Scotinomys teguina]